MKKREKKQRRVFPFVTALQLTTNFQLPVSKLISRNRPLLSGQRSEPAIIMHAYIVILFKNTKLYAAPFPLNDQTHHLICMFTHTICFPACRSSKNSTAKQHCSKQLHRTLLRGAGTILDERLLSISILSNRSFINLIVTFNWPLSLRVVAVLTHSVLQINHYSTT